MQHKFNSYPTSLAVADINGDGNSEAIVSGNNFEGISLFLLKNNLNEIKIVAKGTYSSVQFLDLNYDGYPDIAAFESRKNRLYFFINELMANTLHFLCYEHERQMHTKNLESLVISLLPLVYLELLKLA